MKEIFGIFGRKKNNAADAPIVVDNENLEEEDLTGNLESKQVDGTPESSSALAQEASRALSSIINKMGFSAKIKATDKEDTIHLDLVGENLGRLIGKEGNTLNALQVLVGGILGKKNAQRVYVKVDANNYRARREQTLQRMARDAAQMALHQQMPVELDPMAPNERRIIHAELSGRGDVHTYSTGDRQDRRIIVAPGSAPEKKEVDPTTAAAEEKK